MDLLDLTELFKRTFKYIIEGFIVAIAAYSIPKKNLSIDEIILIAIISAITFSILDTFIPTINY